MPTKKYTITVLNGLLKGNKYIKYSIPEVNGILEYLDQMGYSASVKKESLKSKKN